jgi:hypothetical protein
MSTEEFIIGLFVRVDDALLDGALAPPRAVVSQ